MRTGSKFCSSSFSLRLTPDLIFLPGPVVVMEEPLKVTAILRDTELKVWGKAIHSLCLIGGTDIQLQFTETVLTLTAYDAALTTFSTIKFRKRFFTGYNCKAKEENNFDCKISAKCLLKPFRSIRFLIKRVSECNIQHTKDSDTMNISILTKFGASLTYSLRLLSDSEILQVDCDVNTLKSKIECDAKFVLDRLSSVSSVKSSGDLTIKATRDEISLRNAPSDLIKKEGKVYSELTLNSVDFNEFTIEQEAKVVISMRDFKNFITFADFMKLPVVVRFQNEQEPLVIMINTLEGSLEGILTLSNKASRQENLRNTGGEESGQISITLSTSELNPPIPNNDIAMENGTVPQAVFTSSRTNIPRTTEVSGISTSLLNFPSNLPASASSSSNNGNSDLRSTTGPRVSIPQISVPSTSSNVTSNPQLRGRTTDTQVSHSSAFIQDLELPNLPPQTSSMLSESGITTPVPEAYVPNENSENCLNLSDSLLEIPLSTNHYLPSIELDANASLPPTYPHQIQTHSRFDNMFPNARKQQHNSLAGSNVILVSESSEEDELEL